MTKFRVVNQYGKGLNFYGEKYNETIDMWEYIPASQYDNPREVKLLLKNLFQPKEPDSIYEEFEL
jgi:hypothetical protein